MRTIKYEVKHTQPEVYEQIKQYDEGVSEKHYEQMTKDRLTKFFEWIESILDPVVDGLRSVRNEW